MSVFLIRVIITPLATTWLERTNVTVQKDGLARTANLELISANRILAPTMAPAKIFSENLNVNVSRVGWVFNVKHPLTGASQIPAKTMPIAKIWCKIQRTSANA